MTEQNTNETTKKEKEFYQKNPNILMYFSTENNTIVFDYDETKIDVGDAMLLAHNTVNEFLKTISQNIKQNQQTQTNNK
jgi:hypothetical protein